jgi:hypothetical protein
VIAHLDDAPPTGIRLTCTSIGERKMLIWRHGEPAKSPMGSPTIMTRPSAGETTSDGPPAITRLRVAKEEQKKAGKTPPPGPRTIRRPHPAGWPRSRHPDERPPGRIDAHHKGPSLSRTTRPLATSLRTSKAISGTGMRLRPVDRDAHHLVLQGQLAFL